MVVRERPLDRRGESAFDWPGGLKWLGFEGFRFGNGMPLAGSSFIGSIFLLTSRGPVVVNHGGGRWCDCRLCGVNWCAQAQHPTILVEQFQRLL